MKITQAGYLEGITEAKEDSATLQEGFDKGFNLASSISFQIGVLMGRASLLKVKIPELDELTCALVFNEKYLEAEETFDFQDILEKISKIQGILDQNHVKSI